MKEKDYKQLYYDLLYENKKLTKQVEDLKTELSIINLNKNIKIKAFIYNQIKNMKKVK